MNTFRVIAFILIFALFLAGCGSEGDTQPPSIDKDGGLPARDSVEKTGPNLTDVKPPFEDSGKKPPFE